jgi:hypothetical protein
MIAFEAILLPDNSVQILKPPLSFPRPRRIIITVLDEDVDIQPDQPQTELLDTVLSLAPDTLAEINAWSPHSTRVPNFHAGLIQISDDFDAPLPDSFWLGEEERDTVR